MYWKNLSSQSLCKPHICAGLDIIRDLFNFMAKYIHTGESRLQPVSHSGQPPVTEWKSGSEFFPAQSPLWWASSSGQRDVRYGGKARLRLQAGPGRVKAGSPSLGSHRVQRPRTPQRHPGRPPEGPSPPWAQLYPVGSWPLTIKLLRLYLTKNASEGPVRQ